MLEKYILCVINDEFYVMYTNDDNIYKRVCIADSKADGLEIRNALNDAYRHDLD
jgi:hypothetical protein